MKRIAITIAGLMLACSVFANTSAPKVKILDAEYYAYTVSKGESLYGIAKKMNWDEARLTALNPESAKVLREGSVLYYPVVVKNSTGAHSQLSAPAKEYTQHKIAQGETLYGVAKQYNTTIEDIVRANPDLSETNFQAGRTIKILANSKNKNTVKETRTLTSLNTLNSIKVKKGDTWEKIAAKYRITPEILRKANPSVRILEKDMWIAVPAVTQETVVVNVPTSDPRETTAEGRREIIEEVKTAMADEQKRAEVRVALVIADPSSNKDMEFARGFLLALDGLKKSPYKINVSIIDGNNSDEASASLEAFAPGLIISTSEKDFPQYIADFARYSDAYALNVFDIKNEIYRSNPQVVQLLTPSTEFNEEAASFIEDNFGGITLLMTGEPEDGDTLAESLLGKFATGEIISLPISELDEFQPEADRDYLVYATPQKKSDVKAMLEKLDNLRLMNPTSDFTVIGRPSWITLTSDFNTQFGALNTYIPSRFYFDPEEAQSAKFISDYKVEYGHSPIKSYPVYAAMGYDVANYFIPAMSATAGDLGEPYSFTGTPLQTGFTLQRAGAAGLYNSEIFMLHCTPFEIENISVSR